MKRYNLIAAEGSKQELIRESRVRQTVRNAAIALAIIFGSLVLYFCLVPALANNDSKYIYFDNGISMYDEVYYSTDGGNSYVEMTKVSTLNANDPRIPKLTNTKRDTDYLYVTKDQIPPDKKIIFKGIASGTVYDSMSNYQISSASREWGYDYKDFQWISDPISLLESEWDCYFAPAKAMQYKYNGQKVENGKLITEYFITPEPWAYTAGVRRLEESINTTTEFFRASDLTNDNFRDFSVKKDKITFTGTFAAPSGSSNGDFLEDYSAKFDNDTYFTKHIRATGGSNIGSNARVIYFTLPSAGKITVYAAGHDSDRTFKLEKKDNSNYSLEHSETCLKFKGSNGSNDNNQAIEVSNLQAGDYRFYVEGGAWRFYGIKVEYTPTAVANAIDPEKLPLVIEAPETEKEEFVEEEIPFESENPMEGTVGSIEELTSEEEQLPEAETVDTEESTAEATDIEEATAEAEFLDIEDVTADDVQLAEAELADTEVQTAEEEQIPEEESIPEEKISDEEVPTVEDITSEEEILSVEEPIAEADIMDYSDDYGIQVMAAGDSVVHNFTENGKESTFFTIKGNLSKDKGTVNYNGLTLTQCLKLESDTTIDFTAPSPGKILLVFVESGATIKIDGTKYTSTGDGIITVDILAGTHSITKADQVNLYYMVYTEGKIANGDGSTKPFGDANKVLDIDNLTNPCDGLHNEIFTISGEGCWVNDINGKYGSGESVDGKQFTANINLEKEGSTSISSIKVSPELKGKVVIYAAKNGDSGNQLRILNSAGQIINTEPINSYQSRGIEYIFNTTDSFYIASNGNVRIYAVAVYYDKDTGGGELQGSTPVKVNPADGSNRTFYGYVYKMEGITGSVNDTNKIGNNSQGADKEGSYATGNDEHHGIDDEAYDKAYNAKATFYDYYSDWELAGTPLNVDRYFYDSTKEDKSELGELYSSIFFRSETDKTSVSNGKPYNGEKKIDKIDSGGNRKLPETFYPITFSEGTNTVSYTYQGDLWNQAIRDYYNIRKNSNSNIQALYFGSNSWFTGNERYDNYPGNSPYPSNKQNWSWNGEVMQEIVTGKKSDGSDIKYYVYNIPDNREYLYRLFNPDLTKTERINVADVFNDVPHGFSNSRAVLGLVEVFSKENKHVTALNLKKTNVEMPYFNEKFILGENEKNAVYGKVYKNVDFDFKLNENENDPDYGYYYYDSTKGEYATRLTQKNGTNDEYYMNYTGVNNGVEKADKTSSSSYQFYPFNSPAANADFYRENLMFGMKLDIPFVTYTNPQRRTGIFKFSGDDDVWVYVDNTLALDIGGTHRASGGIIDMSTGYAIIDNSYTDNSGLITNNDSGNALSDKLSDKERAAFAIGTLNGVKDSEGWIDFKGTAKFFDDSFSNEEMLPDSNGKYNGTVINDNTTVKYKTSVDKDNNRFIVELQGVIKCVYVQDGETKYEQIDTSVDGDITVKFVLNDIRDVLNIKDSDSSTSNSAGSSVDALDEHELTIYYMERGLNSSNLKISFKLPDLGDLEVDKEWADEDFGADHSNDSVKVELYRTINNSTITKTPGSKTYNFESGIDSEVGVHLGGTKGLVTGVNNTSSSGNKSLKISGRTQSYHGAMIKLPAEVSQAGQKVNFGAYVLHGTATGTPDKPPDNEPKILYSTNFNNSSKDGWEARSWGDGEVNVWLSGAGNHSGTGKDYNGLGVGAQENTAKGRTESSHGAALSINNYCEAGKKYSFSVFVKSNTANHHVATGKVTYNLSLEYKYIDSNNETKTNWAHIATVEAKDGNWYQLKNTSYSIPQEAIDLLLYVETSNNNELNNFYIDDVVIATDGYEINESTVIKSSSYANNDGIQVLAEGDSTTKPAKYKLSLRYRNEIGEAEYYPIVDNVAIQDGQWVHLQGSYDLPESVENEYYLVIETEGDSGDLYLMDDFYVDDVSISWEFIEEDKGDVMFVASAVLNSQNDWKKFWEQNVIKSEMVNGVLVNYTYYIRESEINGKKVSETHQATYYYKDDTGKIQLLDPVSLTTTNDQKITAYEIGDNVHIATIANNPYIDLVAFKEWEGDIPPNMQISVSIYDDTGKLIKTIYLDAANNWTAKVTKMPKYRRNDDGTFVEITYYGIESVPNGYEAGYSSKAETVNGKTLYPFTTVYEGETEYLSLTIINTIADKLKFRFELIKRSADTGETLQGVSFELFKQISGDEYKRVANGVTNERGELTLGNGSLTAGRYKLKETKAADGYVLEKSEIIFEITDNDGVLSYKLISPTGNSQYMESGDWDEANNSLKFTLKNRIYKITMPSTGGGGIVYLFAGAFGMIMLSMILVTFADRRRKQ